MGIEHMTTAGKEDMIVAAIRQTWPKAISVTIFVNDREHELTIKVLDKKQLGECYKTLDGEVAGERS